MNRLIVVALLASVCAMPVAAAPAPSATPVSVADDDTATGPALSTTERKALLDGISKTLAEGYVFPDKVPAMVAKLRSAERAGRYAKLDQRALAEAMTSDIHAVVEDAHLAVHYSPKPLPAPGPDQEPTAAEKAERDAFFKSVNYGVRKVEILDGNIGYLNIEAFLDAGKAAPIVDSAMGFLGNAAAIVIDLRGNHGGSPETVALVASYLLPAKTHINDIYLREGNLTKQFWTNSIADSRKIAADVPVYVLTDKKTASGGEELAYDLQQLKRATLVGESTWGGANPGGIVFLSEHFGIFVPGGRAINPITKTNWEGGGVKPDVAVAGDQALAKAIELIKAKAKAS
jgi:hypothetical protein